MGRKLKGNTTKRGGGSLNLPMLMGIFGFIYALSFSFSLLNWKNEHPFKSPPYLPNTEQQQRVNLDQATPFHGQPLDYTLWSKDDTYFETCRRHYIGNYTWGKLRTKFVDKAEAKNVVRAMNIDGLKISETYALYNKETMESDFTLEKMRQIPQPYIIKATHSAGRVSRVKNDTLSCIKGKCEPTPIGKEVLKRIQEQAKGEFRLNFSNQHREMQYKDVPHQLIIEEDISKEIKMDESMWFSSNGKPIFVRIWCKLGDGSRGRAFVNLNFQQVHMSIVKEQMCSGSELVRPQNWDKQVEIATALAKGLPPGIVRIDLYSSDNSVIFSEFTFTTNYCTQRFAFSPRVADGLLHAVQYGKIEPERVTPDLVKSIIHDHDQSWVLIPSENGRLLTSPPEAFPSPVDLCEHANSNHVKYIDRKWQKSPGVEKCLEATKEVASSPLRCIAGSLDTNSDYQVFSGERAPPTFGLVMGTVVWGRAIALLFLIAVMTWLDVGTNKQRNQYMNNIIYLVVLLIVMRLTSPKVESTFSHHTILDTATQSFRAFAYVHPMQSTHIALCHFATYWFAIASWTCKSSRNLLFWQFLYETVTSSVNEYSHLIESQGTAHCTRVLLRETAKMCAFDNLIQKYVLTPLFVYGYLLPRFIFYWISKVPFIVWLGALMIVIYKAKGKLGALMIVICKAKGKSKIHQRRRNFQIMKF